MTHPAPPPTGPGPGSGQALLELLGLVLLLGGLAAVITAAFLASPVLGTGVAGIVAAAVGYRLTTSEE